jgi:hypothetical protein
MIAPLNINLISKLLSLVGTSKKFNDITQSYEHDTILFKELRESLNATIKVVICAISHNLDQKDQINTIVRDSVSFYKPLGLENIQSKSKKEIANLELKRYDSKVYF